MPDPVAPRVFHRSESDRSVAGVCAGLARYLNVDVNAVRVGTVLLALVAGAPVLLVYGIAAIAVPASDDGAAPSALDFEADGMRVSWSSPTVPHAVPWPVMLGGLLSLAFGLFVSAGMLSGLGTLLGVEVLQAIAFVLANLGGLFTPVAALLVGIGALVPRPWAVTLTHGALWIKRPLRSPRKVDLAHIESVRTEGPTLDLRMRSGEVIHVPRPPEGEGWDALRRELERSRAGAEAHERDLRAAEAERKRLERMMGAQRKRE